MVSADAPSDPIISIDTKPTKPRNHETKEFLFRVFRGFVVSWHVMIGRSERLTETDVQRGPRFEAGTGGVLGLAGNRLDVRLESEVDAQRTER